MRSPAVVSEEEAITLFLDSPGNDTFSVLFRLVAPQLLRYLSLRGCEAEDAEDLTQEVMIAVYNHCDTLRDPKLFRPWLFRIAHNALLQHRRKRTRNVVTVELSELKREPDVGFEDPLVSAELAQWMAYLSEEERQVLMLRYIEDLDYREIAMILGIPLGTVQWRIFNAKRKLMTLSTRGQS